jgi:hypothetical protein
MLLTTTRGVCETVTVEDEGGGGLLEPLSDQVKVAVRKDDESLVPRPLPASPKSLAACCQPPANHVSPRRWRSKPSLARAVAFCTPIINTLPHLLQHLHFVCRTAAHYSCLDRPPPTAYRLPRPDFCRVPSCCRGCPGYHSPLYTPGEICPRFTTLFLVVLAGTFAGDEVRIPRYPTFESRSIALL